MEAALPQPWVLKTSADGRQYYHNPTTKQRLSLIEPATPASQHWGWLFKDRQRVYVSLASGEETHTWPPRAPAAKRRAEGGGAEGEGAAAAQAAGPGGSVPVAKRARSAAAPSRLPPGDLRIIAMSNRGQLPMLRNMLRSAEEVGMDLGLFVVYLTPEEGTPAEAAAFGSTQFASVTALKLALIARESAAHASVLWVDNDIVFFTNPLDDLLARAPVPYLMQNDQWSPCTGFWLLRRGTGGGIGGEVLARALEVMTRGNKDSENDQTAFARACKECSCVPVLLEDALYPNGRVYFERKQQARALLVHCNYLKTTAEKEKRFLEHGLWDPQEAILGRVNVVQLRHGDLAVPASAPDAGPRAKEGGAMGAAAGAGTDAGTGAGAGSAAR